MIKGNATDWQTRIRLWAALIMAVYAIGYFVYFALGIFSYKAMDSYQKSVLTFWPLLWLLPFVILTHVSLGLWKLFKRNTLKMPLWEKAQIVLGISIPLFLLPYLVFSYGEFLFFRINVTYSQVLSDNYPRLAWMYVAMILAIWIHAQIGMHGVLRTKKIYPKVRWLIVIVFTLMPIAGVTGYFKAQIELKNKNPYAYSYNNYSAEKATQEQLNILNQVTYGVYISFPLLYLLVLSARGIRISILNKNRNIKVVYPGLKDVQVFPGTTILETSRIADIPHASICGGRGRCTTCRVKIEKGMENLSPIGEREANALKKISAETDIRLACQCECKKDEIAVIQLLPPDVKASVARNETNLSIGVEKSLVVMFADLRGFTKMSEGKFPYDVVFILNKYFHYMGEAIETNGGKIDKFLGDGILAFFGFERDSKKACLQALKAGKQMAKQLVEINEQIKTELDRPLQIGIGINYGEVILGELGYKEKKSLTIIGDTVNTASRLEALNKELESQLIFTSKIGNLSKLDLSKLDKQNVMIRGKTEPTEIFVIKNILDELPDL
ncbi:MAG: adenylate/guanylate cyclase domain-containing protein [Spirochaetes bacterium]|nr:adenylate/guanylate cyclase domain-containing protein [Spirochaetota bacterium]